MGGISAAKTEEWYYASDSFKDLTKKAKLAIELVAEPDPGADLSAPDRDVTLAPR